MKAKIQDTSTEDLHFSDNALLRNLLGEHDKHLKQIERLTSVRAGSRGNVLSLAGEATAVRLVKNLLIQLHALLGKGYPLFAQDIDYAHRILSEDGSVSLEKIFLDKVFISSKKRLITPKSIAQKLYIDAIRNYDMVFGIGPAGTGKTYLAMAMAVAAL
ncbi:MAG TPA: phosphate starvation-inducible protein PhoH, partial [Syntrophus sp. (in: bacteria)]|nr:phosphate starvation-inducible protein PhoH [Syntrophus sp. (in: bacteria)]